MASSGNISAPATSGRRARPSCRTALLRSGAASRLLIVSVLLNPVDAVRTGTLLAIEGTAAFGAASLAFFRFTRGPWGAGLLLALSLLLWIVVPTLAAIERLRRTDI